MAPINDSMNASIVITKTASGDYLTKQHFYDGSKREVALQMSGTQRFLYKDNEFGDGVQIRPDGLLQMFDSEGALATAKPRSTNQCIKK